MLDLHEIKKKPTVIDNKHESIYRCYDVLEYVLEMVERGDSKESIKEVASFLSEDLPAQTIDGLRDDC